MDYCNKIIKNSCCLLFIVIAVALVNQTYGQQLFTFQENIDLKVRNRYSDARSPLHFEYKDKIYFTNYEFKNLKKMLSNNDSMLPIFKYSIKNGNTQKITCRFKKIEDINTFIQYNLKSFTFSEDEKTVLLNFFDYVLIFKRSNDSSYVFSKYFVKPYNYENIKQISKNEFLLYQIYNNTDLPESERVIVSKYNLSDNKIVKHLKCRLNGIEFSHLTHNWFDVKDGYFAVSNSLNYSITIYNSNLDSIYTISRIDSKWDKASDSVLYAIYNEYNIKNSIEKLHEFDNEISRIEKVYYIDKHELLVSYKHPGDNTNIRHIDIWQKKHKKWISTKRDITINTISLSDFRDTVFSYNMPFTEITYSSDIYIYNKKVYFLLQFYCPACIGCEKNESSKKCLDYLEKNGTNFGITVFNIN